MPNTPITGVPIPAAGATDQVPADLMTAFSNAETMFVGRFASAADRDGKITAPVGGQVAWLISPGKFVYYDAILAAWADMMNPTAWDTWTPTLQSGSGVAFTLGGGSSQIGRFRLTGKKVDFQCTWSFGSSVSGPGGSLVFAFPPGLPAANIATLNQTGPCGLFVPNTSDNWLGFWAVGAGGNTGVLHFPRSNGNAAQTYFQDTSDGSSAGTGIPLITGTAFNYPIQVNGTLTASGEYELA